MDSQKPEINTEMGTIRIADEVVSTVAGLAASEVEGVASLSGGWSTDLVEKLGRKNLGKGIKVEVVDGSTSIEISIVVKFGHPIPDVAETVQQEVKQSVETMTGLVVKAVNVNVIAVDIKKDEPVEEKTADDTELE
ncbi:alkaline shock protein [hydrocarbon metagenome]|uniref:Alkaline shock protein n=1 Tax=hydrocarbon metagenome TaxID=938273 RepID=A0A0W8E8W2_9ZZZZ